MNNEIDPFVKLMRDAETDADRANILLTAPVFTLMRLRDEFDRLCRRARFDAGTDYLDALRESLATPRQRGVLSGVAHEGTKTGLLYFIEREEIAAGSVRARP